MYRERIAKLKNELNKKGLKQALYCDPSAIFYLTGKWINPGERFLGLLIGEEVKLFVNELFHVEGATYFKDGDDIVAVLKPYLSTDTLAVDRNLRAQFLLPLMGIISHFEDASLMLDNLRSLKSEDELKIMREASLINDRAMAEFKTLVYEGVSEKEVVTKMLDIYEDLGASGFSFEPIVAFGANAADPHHEPDETTLKAGDIVLFDVGCKYQDYCSDMTRTFFFKEYPDEDKLEIYNLVKEANEKAMKMVSKDITLYELDKCARDIIVEGGYGPLFTHRLGHFIGIDIHEFGDVSQANLNKCQVGNVFSIEPGIYDRDRGIGVRIEDLVVVTEAGYEVLNHYPHAVEVIG